MRKHMVRTEWQASAGFSLIEMIVVVAILAVITAIIVPLTWQAIENAKLTAAQQDVNTLAQALKQYYLDTSTFPTDRYDDTDLNNLAGTGLSNLFENVNTYPPDSFCNAGTGVQGWRGPYTTIDDSRMELTGGHLVPKDPWNNAYLYDRIDYNLSVVASGGPNGVLESRNGTNSWTFSPTTDDFWVLVSNRDMDVTKNTQVEQEIDAVASALKAYIADSGLNPPQTSLGTVAIDLSFLFTGPSYLTGMESIFGYDPWCRPYAYIHSAADEVSHLFHLGTFHPDGSLDRTWTYTYTAPPTPTATPIAPTPTPTATP